MTSIAVPAAQLNPSERLRRLEVHANNGRYDMRLGAAFDPSSADTPQPLWWAHVPTRHVEMIAKAGDPYVVHLVTQLAHGDILRLPLHRQERDRVHARHPTLPLLHEGEVQRTASARTVLPCAGDGAADAFVGYALKLHLTERGRGSLGGTSVITRGEATIAPLMSAALAHLQPALPAVFAFLPEPVGVLATLPAREAGGVPDEIGCVFRVLAPDLVPAFALFSDTEEVLPHIGARYPHPHRVAHGVARLLADEVLRFAMDNNPGTTLEDAFAQLFVDPVFDVVFALAHHGLAHEMHPQNFCFVFDARTGWTRSVVLRDLEGMNYSRAHRLARHPACLFDVTRTDFPTAQGALDAWFFADGAPRERFTLPRMFERTLDFFLGIFFFQLLTSLVDALVITPQQVDLLIGCIRSRSAHFASVHDFDVAALAPAHGDFWSTQTVSGTALFR